MNSLLLFELVACCTPFSVLEAFPMLCSFVRARSVKAMLMQGFEDIGILVCLSARVVFHLLESLSNSNCPRNVSSLTRPVNCSPLRRALDFTDVSSLNAQAVEPEYHFDFPWCFQLLWEHCSSKVKMFLTGRNFDISNTILPLRVRLIPFPNVTLLLLIRFQQQVFSKFHEISNPSHPSCLQMIETKFLQHWEGHYGSNCGWDDV